MKFLTTMSAEELGFFKLKEVISLGSLRLVCNGGNTRVIYDFFKEKLGYSGFVLGIRGSLTQATFDFFKKLDVELCNGSVLLEINIDESNMLMFDFMEFTYVIESVSNFESDELIISKLENALECGTSSHNPIKLVCVPYICYKDATLVTASGFSVECEPLTFIQFNSEEGV